MILLHKKSIYKQENSIFLRKEKEKTMHDLLEHYNKEKDIVNLFVQEKFSFENRKYK